MWDCELLGTWDSSTAQRERMPEIISFDCFAPVQCSQHHLIKCQFECNVLLAISFKDVDNSGEPGPHAKGANHQETRARQLQSTPTCADWGDHFQFHVLTTGGHVARSPKPSADGSCKCHALRPLDRRGWV